MSVRKQRPNETDEEYQARRERYRETAKRYREQNREKVRDLARRATERLRQDLDKYEKRKAQNRARSKIWREKHNERILEHERERRKDPVWRENHKQYELRRLADPERMARHRERRRQAWRRKVTLPDGHSGACELCGVTPPPRKSGTHGLNEDHRHDTGEVRGLICTRCNNLVAALDLRFTDPEHFEKLMAWSNRGAPPVPVSPARKGRRDRRKIEHPMLFESK